MDWRGLGGVGSEGNGKGRRGPGKERSGGAGRRDATGEHRMNKVGR